MVRYYSYDGSQYDAVHTFKNVLESNGYFIDHFAPESGYILTKSTEAKIRYGTYQYHLSVQIDDKVTLYVMSSRDIFTRGSEVSIGGGDFGQKEKVDRLPYKIQKELFQLFEATLDSSGFERIIS